MKNLKKGGAVSRTGYKSDSPDRFNEFNIIPSNQITMKGVKHKVKGVDDTSHEIMMYPGYDYTFPGNYVTETPEFQDGGGIDDGHYQSAATLAYYKEKLNNKLKAKNPKAFEDYFKGLVDLRRSGKSTDAEKYVQETPYEEYLSAQEVQQELGEEYPTYVDSLKRVNQYNVQQGRQPLYGTNETDQDITNLNYGRRFASLTMTPSYTRTNTTRNTNYARDYKYDPDQGVQFTEKGDMSLNPFKKQQGGGVKPYKQFGYPGQPGIDENGLVYGSQPGIVTQADTDALGLFQDHEKKSSGRRNLSPSGLVQGVATSMMNEYLDPSSMYNVIGDISAGANLISNHKKRKYDEERLRTNNSSDALFPVNQQADRGNYVTTGSSYGMFRPDQMGAKSPEGMHNGMYYPTMQMGGDIVTKRGNKITDSDLKKFAASTGINFQSKEEYGSWLDKFAAPVPEPTKSKITYPYGKRGEIMTQDEWDYSRKKRGYPDVYSDKVQGTDNFAPGEIFSNEIRNDITEYRKLRSMQMGGENFADKYQVDNINSLVEQGSHFDMMDVVTPAFMDIPVGLAGRKSFESTPNYDSHKQVDISSNTKFAYDYFTKKKNLPSHIAAGIVGNLYQESGLQPGAVEKTNTANGRGIAQWDVRDRWKGYLNWATKNDRNAYDLESQLDYVLVEPGESSRALEKLKTTNTAEQAAVIFGKLYERPSEKHANWSKRTSIARKLHAGEYSEGGEYELSDQEIFDLKAQGYDIELL